MLKIFAHLPLDGLLLRLHDHPDAIVLLNCNPKLITAGSAHGHLAWPYWRIIAKAVLRSYSDHYGALEADNDPEIEYRILGEADGLFKHALQPP